jgi:AcrR family transcriptional regulator
VEASRKRKDAARNRERIILAARGLLPDGSARAVARAAGVSAATLYRHFPSRHELLDAVHDDQRADCAAALADATADPHPARGLRSFIQHAYQVRAADPQFVAAYRRATGSPDRRDAFRRDLAALVVRARAAGAVRPDVTLADVLLVITAGGGVTAPGRAERVARSRRLAEITLAGLGVRAQ